MINEQDSIEQASLGVRLARNDFRPKVVPNIQGSFGRTDLDQSDLSTGSLAAAPDRHRGAGGLWRGHRTDSVGVRDPGRSRHPFLQCGHHVAPQPAAAERLRPSRRAAGPGERGSAPGRCRVPAHAGRTVGGGRNSKGLLQHRCPASAGRGRQGERRALAQTQGIG